MNDYSSHFIDNEADIEMLNNVLGAHSKKMAETGLKFKTPDCQSYLFGRWKDQTLLIWGVFTAPVDSFIHSCLHIPGITLGFAEPAGLQSGGQAWRGLHTPCLEKGMQTAGKA